MCGRYSLFSTKDELTHYFSATCNFNFDKSYNVAPSATIPVLVQIENDRFIVPMRWGFIPAWHKLGERLTMLNNAKLETVDIKPSFRLAFKRHRCIFLVNGFYEWDQHIKPKQPFYFNRKDATPFGLAGIWDKWISEDKVINSCCIITEPANDLVGKIHDRMPAIIHPSLYNEWLDNNMTDTKAVKDIAQNGKSYADIIAYPVTTKVNRVAYNNINCIKDISK